MPDPELTTGGGDVPALTVTDDSCIIVAVQNFLKCINYRFFRSFKVAPFVFIKWYKIYFSVDTLK